MAFRDILKKYRESQEEETSKSGADSKNSTGSSEKSTSGTTGSGDSSSSFREKLKKFREQQATSSVQGWSEVSINLINDVRTKSDDWYDDDEHQARSERFTSLLAQADNWRKMYAGNNEATSYIDSVVSALSEAKTYSFNSRQYYSQWKTKQDYRDYVAYQKDYETKKNFDITAGEKEIAVLENILEEYKALTRWTTDEKGARRAAEIRNQYGDEKVIKELISQKKQYLNQSKHIQDGIALSSVSDNADFKQYSGYVSTYDDSGWAKLLGKEYDTTYEYVNNRNGFRDEYKSKNRAYSSDNPWSDGESTYEEKGYDYLNENEIAIYNYYYAKDGKEAAEKYLDSIQETLNQRKATSMYENMEGKTALELAFGVVAGLDQWESGTKNLFNTEDDYIAQTATQIASGMVRGDLADDGFKILGQSLGQIGYDAITTTANMAPSMLTSMAANMIVPGSGAVIGNTMMFASSAGGAYQEALNLGYGKDQARAYSTLVGASEAGLQYLLGGIGSLGGKVPNTALTKMLDGIDNAFARTALKLGGNMLSEGFEEGLQEVLTPLFQNWTLMAGEDINWSEVAYSGLLGALTAGFMEGPSTIAGEVSTYQTGKQIKAADISAERLAEIGKTFSADTMAYQLAGKVNENTGAYTMGRLFNEIGATMTEQNISDITSALVEKGMTRDVARANAEAMATVVEGGNLTDLQVAIIESNEVLAEAVRTTIIDSNATWFQRTNGYKDALMALAQEKTAPRASRTNPAQQSEENAPNADNVGGQNESSSEVIPEADIATPKVKSISTIKNGQATIKLEDGSEVNVSESGIDPDDGVFIETIASIDGISVEDANFIMNTLKAAPGASAQMNALGAKEAYKYGFYGFSQDHIAKHGVFANSLNETQRKAIYEAGQKARATQVAQKQATVRNKRTVGDKNATTGKVHFDGDRSTLTERQSASLSAMETVADALGVQIHVFESQVGENGKRIGANGWYDPADNSIHIDLHAGATGEGTMLFTLAHELTHHIRKWSPAKFKILADFLMQEYGKKGVNVDALVRAQIAKAKRNGRTISYDTAYEEVVADSMETMLSDGSIVEKMAKLKQVDRSLWQKIKDFISEMAAKIRKVYEGMAPDSVEGRYVAEMVDSIEKLQELFTEALVDASENFQTAEKNTTEDGGVKYSERYLAADANSEILAMVNKVANGDFKANERVYLGTVSDVVADQINELTGIQVNGFRVAIEARQIDHILKDHGADGDTDHSMADPDDIAKMEYVLVNPDDIRKAGKTQAYTYMRNGRNRTADTVLYEKKIGTQSYYVVQAVPDTKAKTLYIVTAFIGNSGYKKEAPQLINAKGPDATAKTGSVNASVNSIRNDSDNVKNESLEALDVAVDSDTESVAPSLLFSERTWTESDYVQEREKAAEEISKAIGVSKKKAKAYIDSVNSIAKMIAEDRVRLDYFSSPGRSSFVGNVEYGGSFDFSTLCKKRRLLTGTFTAIQKALPNTALTADEILDIRNRMKDKGLEVSCGLCYVEGSRANMGQFAKEFLRLYKQYYPDAWQPNMADVNTPDGIEWVRINHPECYEQYEYFWNHYGTLKEGDKNLFASQQKPKLYQLHTEYKGEILQKFKDDGNVEDKNLNGGIRLQSFSDFEIVHLIDTMQIIMDMSRVGLAGQAYTKVPDFAWALGDTGLKINLSLIAKGVDANGKLIFDDVEGMPIADAVELRNRYSKNVGTILVAFNDEQLLAAMADDRVDYIIPFHRSQWKKSQYGAMGLPAKTKDYTYMQNEKFIKPQYHEYRGRMVKDKATNYMPNEYWDFSKSGKENAIAYLEMCARNNKRPKFYKLLQNNGDGSYSLKADGSTDGYWKLLIDFKMYDNEGNGSPQMPVKPEFNMEEATRMLDTYKGGHSNFPVAQGIVDEFVKEYKETHKGVKFSDRDSTGSQLSKEQQEYFKDSKARDENGSLVKVYHSSPTAGFFKFDGGKGKGNYKYGKYAGAVTFFTDLKQMADSYAPTNEKVDTRSRGKVADGVQSLAHNVKSKLGIKKSGQYEGYVNLTNPYVIDAEGRNWDEVDSEYSQELYDKFKTVTTEECDAVLSFTGKVTDITSFTRSINTALKKAEDPNASENVKRVASAYEKVGDMYTLLYLSHKHFSEDSIGEMARTYATTNDVVFRALEDGSYDGVIINNVLDYSAFNTPETETPGNLYITFQSNQFKAADNTAPTSDPDIRYSDRDTESVSNRSLLANALEGVAQNDIEKQKIQEYKGKIDLINSEERKLQKLNEQIKELSFAKGPKDTKAIRNLQFEAKQTANRISTYDKQLLRLEASKPLQDVLTREKKMAYQRAEKKGKEALAAYKEKATQTQKELLTRYQETRKKGIENRHRTEMRHKIKDVVNELNQYLLNGTKDKRVMMGLKKAVAEALDAVNMDTVGAEERIAKLQAEMMKARTPEQIQEIARKIDHIQQMGDKMSNRLKALKDAYREIAESDDPLIANAHDDVIEAKLESVIEKVGNTPLRDMNLSQLEEVYDMYRMVLTTIRNSNKAFKAAKKESIAVLGNRVMEEVDKVGGKRKYNLAAAEAIKKFAWNNLKPVYAFQHIGSDTFTEVFNNVRAGEDVWAVDVTEAREFYLDKAKKHKYGSWNFDKRYTFKSSSGMDFSLNLEQIMSLYAYSKRDQAADHLQRGGIVIDESTEITMKTKLGFKAKFNPTEATAYNISEETLAEITGKLTDDQKQFVDEMQEYLSTVMGAKGNEVSLELYGIKLFKEKFYFPLKSASQFMAKAKEQQQGEVKIKNSGFSKETVKKASNPIVLTPFMDVWAGHVNEMSMYHAFVLPMEDFYRVWSYRTPTSDTMATESVEMFIQNAYGKGATKYIDQLLKDLNGGARTDSTTGVINKMMGMFKKGAVFASLSVVVQQPSAIARATALVDTKYFIGPKVDRKRHKLLWNEVKQYAPVAIIKEMGYFDTNMGKSTQDFILGKEYSGIGEKMKALFTDSGYRDEILSKAPALADEMAWCSIWEAVKRETKSRNKGMDVKSEAFLQKAGERFTEVIVKTQVYDSVLSRSANMRSKDTGMKMATAFMAEPTTSINMIADALLQGKRGNRKYARGAIGAVIASQILNSILVSFVYAARDDDEDETYWEKYISTLSSEILDSLNPGGYIPFIKDIVSIVQGYDVERSDMAVVSDLWNAYKKLGNENLSVYRKVEGFAGSIAQIFGLPVKNIMRDVRGIYQTINSFMNGQLTTKAGIDYAIKASIPEWLGGGEVSNKDQLYEATLSGDKDHLSRVMSRYEDQDAVNSAMRSAIKEHYIAGDISSDTAISYLVKYAGLEEDDAYWKVEEWEYENATGEDFGKYNEFFTAVETGKNLKAVIKQYTDNGVKQKTLASQITSHFKPLYMEMSKAERANIKGYLINAMMVLGDTREEAEEDIAKWQYEADYPELSDRITYTQYKRWQADGKPNGVSLELYTDVAEYRDDGTSSSAKSQEDVAAYINSLPISTAQKDALWCCFWKESTLKKAPWH